MMNIVVVGEMGAGKASLLLTLENGGKFPKKSQQDAEGKTSVKYGKNNKKTMNLGFFKLQPEIAHHGTGWEDEGVKTRLADTNKDNKLHGALYCIPARTYKAKHDPICCAGSIDKWLTMLTAQLPDGVPIVIIRTKIDMETSESKSPSSEDLAFTADQAKEILAQHENVCGYYDVSAKANTGVDEFYSTVGSLLVNNAKGSCVIM